MQQENALIGVALAAYYPDITLSANFGLHEIYSASNAVIIELLLAKSRRA